MSSASIIRPSLFLRRALWADAIATGAAALLMSLGAAMLSAWLGWPEALLRWAGIGLVPYAALIGWLAARETLPRIAVVAVVFCNLLWTIDRLALVASGAYTPTQLGKAFVTAQAALVAAFAALQWIGLGRSLQARAA